jgi:photosystem II stability/assembly factor-like uncharacterized protein
MVAMVTAGLVAACSSGTEQAPPAPAESGDSLFGHVHGLGVDPADGTVYVATHHGLFRQSAGRLDPVGASKRDLMGFTVAGPKTFLSSGHPAPGESTPNPLGMVESRDGGNTWTTLSLSGESDFHALDAVGATVYGYDGAVKASTDGGHTWQTRGSPRIADLAVNPGDPNTVAATTEAGVVLSLDGGRTFGAAQGPVVVFVAWSAQGTLYGLAPDSTVYRSSDGAMWTKAATVPGGGPQALGAAADGRVLVATAGGVFESRDQGTTVTKLA